MEGALVSDHEGDKYRSHLYGEGEKETQWRFGAPPKYDAVNKLFEQGRTQVETIIFNFSILNLNNR